MVCELNIGGRRQDKGFYQFYISDNGPGIAEAYQEKVFGIFKTLQARDVIESTGVGLSIVRKQVENLGGKVWIESTEGKGATFIFTIKKKKKDE